MKRKATTPTRAPFVKQPGLKNPAARTMNNTGLHKNYGGPSLGGGMNGGMDMKVSNNKQMPM